MNRYVAITKGFFRDNAWFFAAFIVFFIMGFALLVGYGKIESHILLNGCHTPFLDTFFKYFTYIGGGFPVYFGIALLLVNIRGGFYIMLSQLLNLILTHAIKFPVSAPRPLTFFNEMGRQLPPVVEGVKLHVVNSFPSGHTSAVFAFCLCLAAMLPKRYKWLGCVLCLVAVLGSYSRIYLSQHFLEDTLMGSVIGIISAFAVYIWLYCSNRTLPEKGIIRLCSDKLKNKE